MMRDWLFEIRVAGDRRTAEYLMFKALCSLSGTAVRTKIDVAGGGIFDGWRLFKVEDEGRRLLRASDALFGGKVVGRSFFITVKYSYDRGGRRGWGWSDRYMVEFFDRDGSFLVRISRVKGLGRTGGDYIVGLLVSRARDLAGGEPVGFEVVGLE